MLKLGWTIGMLDCFFDLIHETNTTIWIDGQWSVPPMRLAKEWPSPFMKPDDNDHGKIRKKTLTNALRCPFFYS